MVTHLCIKIEEVKVIKSLSIFHEQAVGDWGILWSGKLEYNSYSCVGQWKLTLPTPNMMKSDNGILRPSYKSTL